MKKVFSFTQSIMNGTVTMNTDVALFATRELAEQTQADIKASNAKHDLGLSVSYGDVQELPVYETKDEIPFYQKYNGEESSANPMKGNREKAVDIRAVTEKSDGVCNGTLSITNPSSRPFDDQYLEWEVPSCSSVDESRERMAAILENIIQDCQQIIKNLRKE